MTNSRQNEDDYLGQYLNPEGIEKAPEGLTEKIMSRIHVEKVLLKVHKRYRFNVLVPAISAIITIAFIVFIVIFSSPADNNILSGVFKYIPKLSLNIPVFTTDTFSGFNLPAIVTYISIGFFILMIFDRFLNRLFHK
jgi:hypothetical protein